jgi:crotonobetainyl-CoA:carnitine CoA-transferase CaiB-like acyl-CoA transferase
MAMGLHARERTGTGQYIETTMLASTGYVQSDMLVQYEGRPDILVPDQGQHGIHPRYRLYECSAGWLFVAAILHDEWVALAEAVGRADWLTDERFATWESQLEHEDALVAELGEILRSSSAHDWQRRLVERGAPATVADEFGFEEFLVANTPHLPMSHAEYGDYWWRPPLVRLDAVTPTVVAAAPGLGEHTAALLAECGFTPNERVELLEQGVVRGPRA